MAAEEWITVREAARMSGYHIISIPRLINSGQVEARKFATVWQVSRKSLLAYVKRAEERGERRGPQILIQVVGGRAEM